jgi:hypothetical protein
MTKTTLNTSFFFVFSKVNDVFYYIVRNENIYIKKTLVNRCNFLFIVKVNESFNCIKNLKKTGILYYNIFNDQ